MYFIILLTPKDLIKKNKKYIHIKNSKKILVKKIEFEEWENLKEEIEIILQEMNNNRLKDLTFKTKELMEYFS